MLEAIIKRLKHDEHGVSNVIVVMLSLVLIVVIVANVVLWSYQMNQLDWEKMQENIAILDVTHISESYNPSGYVLGGSTSWLSGDVSDLTSDDCVYMTFRSYPSVIDTPIQNMNFTSDLSNWTTTYDAGKTAGEISWENVGSPLSGAGSVRGQTVVGRNKAMSGSCKQDFNVTAIPCSAYLTFYWEKNYTSSVKTHTIEVRLISSATAKYVWSNTTNGTFDWTWESINVTSYIDGTGTWTLELYWTLENPNDPDAQVWANFDDVGVKLVYEYTIEVEFTGSSNAEDWIQLNWTVDSAWTIGLVNITLQLYNYTLGGYPTSGNGYIAYTSDNTPNTDETKSQTVNVNPNHFRNATGHWKMKVKGVKATDTQFDFKTDWIEFKVLKKQTLFAFKNEGSLTSHLVSIWSINSTVHQRYDISVFVNSGETLSYSRFDIYLPTGQYVVKVVTERGNMDIYSST
ncbi:MAG: hypothetical protein OEW71_00260 [Candidatus Bathyarchaeota archaeon]|nr:hypothetical protein [Candidatus Bathyarchaeota archaeon]